MLRVPPDLGAVEPGFSAWNPAAPTDPPVDDVPLPLLLQAAASSATAARAVMAPKPREHFRIELLLLLSMSAKVRFARPGIMLRAVTRAVNRLPAAMSES